MRRSFASERDFVAQYLLPALNTACEKLGVNEFVDLAVEKRINSGISDLVVERAGNPVMVLEAKFKRKTGAIERNIEPRDPAVVKQAVSYAVLGGYPFYATCNVRRIVLFQLQAGVKLFESEISSFVYEDTPDWAERILGYILGLEKVEPKPLDDALVDILMEAHSDLYPEFLRSLRKKLEEDDVFQRKFIEWIESQGLRLTDENIRLIASQATYLELNKFLFYHVIRLIYPERLNPLRIEDYQDVAGSLERFYNDVLEIDYAPIYEKTIIGEIPFTRRAEERTLTLLETLNLFDFSNMESDFLGNIYEKLIPPLERKKLGQFYTPPKIVDFITRLTIENKNAIILDPGCGSGGFLVRAYHLLRTMKGISPNVRDLTASYYNRELLDQIYGVDINQFPAHLSVINLAIQNPYAKINKVNVLVEDFFNLKPGISTLSGFKSFTTDGQIDEISLPPYFDVIIGNPPYIRQELLSLKEKEKIKELIENEYYGKLLIGSNSYKKKGIINLKKQSDIYIYFFIHGLKMLKNEGKLGFITSNKWLEVSYGIPFQQFLLNNTKIKYIIEFDRAIFPDAEINTAITIIEKENNENNRNSNIIKFVRLKKSLSVVDSIELLKNTNQNLDNEDIKINTIKQDQIKWGKWNLYLRAPAVYNKIVNNKKIKPFIEISNIFRGPTTGYNPYFILHQESLDNLEIEPEFLKPCLTSPKKIKNLIVKDVDSYFFIVRKNKQMIQNTNAKKYIEYGENYEVEIKRGSNRGYRKLTQTATIKNRKPYWYSLPEFPEPDILIPKLADKRLIALRNDSKVQATDVFYYVILKNDQDATCVTAYINSSVGGLLGELFGRSYGGGVLDIKVYETKQFPILDPSFLSKSERINVENAFDDLVEAIKARITDSDDETRNNEKVAYNNLDKIIFDILDLSEHERKQVVEGLREMQEIRRLRTIS